MENLKITINLADECYHLSDNDKIESHVIEISKKDSIQDIIALAMQAWNIKSTENGMCDELHSLEVKKLHCLKIESIDGKTFHNKTLNEKNFHDVKNGKNALLQLQLSPKIRLVKIVEELKNEFHLLKAGLDNLDDKASKLLGECDYILPPHLLDVFGSLCHYTKDANFVSELLEMKAFTLITKFIYLRVFQDPIDRNKSRSSDHKDKSSIKKRILKSLRKQKRNP